MIRNPNFEILGFETIEEFNLVTTGVCEVWKCKELLTFKRLSLFSLSLWASKVFKIFPDKPKPIPFGPNNSIQKLLSIF